MKLREKYEWIRSLDDIPRNLSHDELKECIDYMPEKIFHKTKGTTMDERIKWVREYQYKTQIDYEIF